MANKEQLLQIADAEMGEGGIFVYDTEMMHETAQSLLDTEMPYGMTVRYAAKANPHDRIVSQFEDQGLHFDASSVSEAQRLLRYGVSGEKISLSSQVVSVATPEGKEKLESVLDAGVLPVATSMSQILTLNNHGVDQMAIRLNPGEGSGHNNRTTVGGPASSFGIWWEHIPEVKGLTEDLGISIDRIHTHIGSGVDPNSWKRTIDRSLKMVKQFPDVTTLDIGGGYKIARMKDEVGTDMDEVLSIFASRLEKFSKKNDREIHLEIEPGTLLVGNAGTLLGRVEDIASTPKYDFLKLNVGMNAVMRTVMYGAQHPIKVLNSKESKREYVVTGPCCESGDIWTPAPGDPEEIVPRKLKKALIGDYVAIGGVGAYCASMSAKQYNDIPEPTDYFI